MQAPGYLMLECALPVIAEMLLLHVGFKARVRMQPVAFTSGTGTACSVHNKSVYDNENTKWVASFQSESVKGCCGIRVYLD